MRLRKIAAGILAAAMAVMSVPQAASAVDFDVDLSPNQFEVGDIFYVKADKNTGNVIGDPQKEEDYAEGELYYGCKVLSDGTIGISAPMRKHVSIYQYRITLPDTVAGYTVTQLGYPARTDSFDRFGNYFASINVPDTVQIIDNGAFWGNVALEEINFGANSQLINSILIFRAHSD